MEADLVKRQRPSAHKAVRALPATFLDSIFNNLCELRGEHRD